TEIAWRCLRSPPDDRVRIRVVAFEHRTKEWCPGNPAVVSREGEPQRLTSEPGTASLIRDDRSPSADAMVPALQDGPADAAGTRYDPTAIAAVVRADAGGMRVGGEQNLTESVLLQPGRREFGRFCCARQSETRGDARKVAGSKVRLLEALVR